MLRLITAVVIVGLAAPLFADIIHLKNGGKIEGTITESGDVYLVKHRFGTATVKKSEVVRVEQKETLKDVYLAKRKKADLQNPDALVKLGKWCRENGWQSQAIKDFHAAIALAPDHRGAHHALGHIFYEGSWRTEREIMELRGYVKHQGKWVTKEDVARLKAVEAKKRAERKIIRQVRRWFRDIARGSRKQCDKAYDEVVTFAREHKNAKLEKYAGDVLAAWENYWRAVRSAKGILEVRATMSTLKRPIPTFQTSLGAGSTPVTLQLPELSIARVQTTVEVPLGRGK